MEVPGRARKKRSQGTSWSTPVSLAHSSMTSAVISPITLFPSAMFCHRTLCPRLIDSYPGQWEQGHLTHQPQFSSMACPIVLFQTAVSFSEEIPGINIGNLYISKVTTSWQHIPRWIQKHKMHSGAHLQYIIILSSCIALAEHAMGFMCIFLSCPCNNLVSE